MFHEDLVFLCLSFVCIGHPLAKATIIHPLTRTWNYGRLDRRGSLGAVSRVEGTSGDEVDEVGADGDFDESATEPGKRQAIEMFLGCITEPSSKITSLLLKNAPVAQSRSLQPFIPSRYPMKSASEE
ncbi:hypothetical protein PISMIDRAFT_19095 [Pisolithus microcarpus 441]|uniref:Uncharacterized protein n=1 Tax=Pisolithus microcarpus 441 TaxID=765257 RepID=A0A0C9YVS3_9AGAM|nr:hypothetical protein PISMIDRAFT_19095 [Pisolithus microcarpus 441]